MWIATKTLAPVGIHLCVYIYCMYRFILPANISSRNECKSIVCPVFIVIRWEYYES